MKVLIILEDGRGYSIEKALVKMSYGIQEEYPSTRKSLKTTDVVDISISGQCLETIIFDKKVIKQVFR